jgi:hypothetical protein
VFIDFTSTKDAAVGESVKNIVRMMNNFQHHKVSTMQSDNAEVNTTDFKAFKKQNGIKSQYIISKESWMNGRAERFMQTVERGVAAMLLSADMPETFWQYAAQYFVHIYNVVSRQYPVLDKEHECKRGMTRRGKPRKRRSKYAIACECTYDSTPYEMYFGRTASIDDIHVFGCRVFVTMGEKEFKDTRTTSKFSNRGRRCIFVGVDPERKGFLVYDSETRKVTTHRNVRFDEETYPYKLDTRQISEDELTQKMANQQAEKITKLMTDVKSNGDYEKASLYLEVARRLAHINPHVAEHFSTLASEAATVYFEHQKSFDSALYPGPTTSINDIANRDDSDQVNSGVADNKEGAYPTEVDNNTDDEQKKPNLGKQSDSKQEGDLAEEVKSKNQESLETKESNQTLKTRISPEKEPQTNKQTSKRKRRADSGKQAIRRSKRKKISTYFTRISTLVHKENFDDAEREQLFALNAFTTHAQEPKTYREAMESPDKEMWRQAIKEELDKIYEFGTWKYTNQTDGHTPIPCKWVFKCKKNEHGEVIRYKARLVAVGTRQRQGYDFNETYAPVANMKSFGTVVALAAQEGMSLHQLDIKNAYLNGEIDGEVYMRAPQGDERKSARYVKLKKALYGLKQSGKIWNDDINNFFVNELKFTRSKFDPCVYFCKAENGDKCIVLLYVDDILIATKNTDILKSTKEALKKKYQVDDQGELNWFLGIKVDKFDRGYKISQASYIEAMAQKFGLAEAKLTSNNLTPMRPKLKLDESTNLMTDNRKYQNIIGSLLYISLATRPDIAYSVSYLARFSNSPTHDQYRAAKDIIRYLLRTKDHGITYIKHGGKLTGYVDSDFADDKSRKSRSGFVFTLGGGAIAWKSNYRR